ncbi:MAG: hypothetical protein H5T91_05830 [Synergistetes bacterium]|nr:hypothetical protein [Synergistota bacterium]
MALSIIIIAILGIIGGGFAFLYSSQQAISRADVRGSQSFFAAEAGINEAVSKYKSQNPFYSLSEPKWFYGIDAKSLSLSWTPLFLPDHDLFVEGAITFRVENAKIYDGGSEVYFYVEGVLKEGEKVASRFPLALRMNKLFAPQGEDIDVEAGIGVGEVIIKRNGEVWRRLSQEGYRGGQALERAFTLVGGGREYEIVLGPGVYLVPMKRQGDYCYALGLEGNKSIVLRSAKGWGPHWVKIIGVIPYRSSPNITDPYYWSTIFIRNGAELRIEDVWISPPIQRENIEKGVFLDRDISAILVDDVSTRLVVENCVIKNRDIVTYVGSHLSGVRVLLYSKGVSELAVSRVVFDAGNFLDYEGGSSSYAVRVSKLSDKNPTLNAEISNSVFTNHDVAIVNEASQGSFNVTNSLFWKNSTKVSGHVNLINTVEEDPQFKKFYSFLKESQENVEYFRHWDSYVPQENSVLESRNIGLTSSYWNTTIPVPKGGEILSIIKLEDSYKLLKFEDVNSAFDALQGYYNSVPNGSSVLVFGRGFWYLSDSYEFKNVGSFMMISTWGPLFTPLFVFLPEAWEKASSDKGVLNFSEISELKIYGFYFGLSGGKDYQGEKTFIKVSNISNLEIADCVFKRIYGGMGRVVEIKSINASDIGIYNNVFDHEYRRIVGDASGTPTFYDRDFVDTLSMQYSGNMNVRGNLFWGESSSGGHNDSVSAGEEDSFFLDGGGKIIKSVFNPFSYRLILSDSNNYLERNFDGGDMGIRMDLYPYIRLVEGDNAFIILENQIEKITRTETDSVLASLDEGETLLLGSGTYSISSDLHLSKNGLGIVGVWGPYYSKINLSSSLSIAGDGALLYGLGFEVQGSFSEGAPIFVSGTNFSVKDIFVKIASSNASWRYGIKVSSASGMVKNILINGGYVQGSDWLTKGDYGLYVPAGSILIDHVNSLKHNIAGIRWSGRIYGCNSYFSGNTNYDPSNVGSSNLSVDPQGSPDMVCYLFDSPCHWWNNSEEADTGSYRGIDWANIPVSPR